MSHPQMVRIVWTDSGTFHENGWESAEQIKDAGFGLSDVTTVGTLVHEEDDKYFIALSSDEKNQHYYGIQVIGKFAVKEFDQLSYGSSAKVSKRSELPEADYFKSRALDWGNLKYKDTEVMPDDDYEY